MGKRGPKAIEIDWTEFNKLCGFQCTSVELASWFDCSVDTLENRVKENFNMKLSEYIEEKRGAGKVSLRRAQYQAAIGGNTALLIWLGKQYLGQTDKSNIDLTNKVSLEELVTKSYAEEKKDAK